MMAAKKMEGPKAVYVAITSRLIRRIGGPHGRNEKELCLAISVPMLFNATMLGAALLWANANFDGVNKRFDDMRYLWRAGLRRVEEVLGSRT